MTSEYHKIETLYERGDNFKVKVGEFKNRTYSLLKTWRWTEKIDGTNIRFDYAPEEGRPALIIGGKTDRANLPADLLSHLHELVTADKIASIFQCPVVLYGEGYGAGIQKGGDYSPTKKFILFDVLVEGKWWLNQENVEDVGLKLGLDVVPVIGDMSIEEATDMVRDGFNSIVARRNEKSINAEGLVGRPLETLYDKRGYRLITKLKTKDF